MKAKGSFTVEAALVCPFLCLILCGMLQFSLQLYQKVDGFSSQLMREQESPAIQLIRLETVAEDVF